MPGPLRDSIPKGRTIWELVLQPRLLAGLQGMRARPMVLASVPNQSERVALS